MTYGEIEELTRCEICDETGVEAGDSRIKSYQMLAYANEAETEACIRARLLVDSSSSFCLIPVEIGTTTYTYDPRIFLILRGRLTGATKPLSKVSHTIMDERCPGWEDQSGKVETFVTGMDKGKLRLYRKPTATGVLNLTVARTPLQLMQKTGDSPEIPAHLHPALILWIKHKVYNMQHSELFDKNRSDVHLAAFEQKFGQRTANPFDVFDAMQIPEYFPEECGQEGYY
jgi:hypothetical protein